MPNASGGYLRRLATDTASTEKRLSMIEGWVTAGRVQPWQGVLMAEWWRRYGDGAGDPRPEDFDALLTDEELVEIMREQADGPWMVYVDQSRGIQANDRVMSFLTELEDASTNA